MRRRAVHFKVADSDALMAEFDAAMASLSSSMAERSAPLDGAKLHYDMLGDCLVWSDESPDVRDPDDTEFTRALGWLRLVFRHRTCAMLGLGNDYVTFWQRAKALFPTWVGFRPERCVRTEAAARRYAAGVRSVQRACRQCANDLPTGRD